MTMPSPNWHCGDSRPGSGGNRAGLTHGRAGRSVHGDAYALTEERFKRRDWFQGKGKLSEGGQSGDSLPICGLLRL